MQRTSMISRTHAARLIRACVAVGLAVGTGMLVTPGIAKANTSALTITSATEARGVVTLSGTITCTTAGNDLEIAVAVHQLSTGADSGIGNELFPRCQASGVPQTWTIAVPTHVYTAAGRPVVFKRGAAIVSACSRDNTANDADPTTEWGACTGDQNVTLTRK